MVEGKNNYLNHWNGEYEERRVGVGRSIGYRINEILLLGLILIQASDFLKILPPFWDYVNKIINWVLIGSLLYLSSPSTIFFGKRRRWWDASLILAFFLLVLKNFVSFAQSAREEMLGNVLNYVQFVPAAASQVKNVIIIPLSEGAYNAFNTLGVMPVNVSILMKTFATQITPTNPSIGFELTTGNQTVYTLLRAYGPNGMVLPLYNSIFIHAAAIEETGFIIGACVILCLGVYAALRYNVEERGVLNIIHEDGEVKDTWHTMVRVFAVFFVIVAFFVLLFNLAVEWLAIAVDVPFLMLGVAVVIFLLFRSRSREGAEENVIDRMGNFGNDFLQDFGGLFQEQQTVLLGLSGLLVLHLLTDVGSFVLPYLTGIINPLYFSHLGPGHEPIVGLLIASWTGSLSADIALTLLYILNVAGILALFLLPVYIWYKAFKIRTRKEDEDETVHHPRLPAWLVSLSLTAMTTVLLVPAFNLSQVKDSSLVGVDLQTRVISTANPVLTAALLFSFFVIFYLFHFLPRLRIWFMAGLFYATIGFFGYYILLFFLAAVSYYIRESIGLLSAATAVDIFLSLWLFILLIINLLFYVFSYMSFVYEAHRE